MQATTAAILGLGFLLGLKHAMDADHVVAVSTIVSEQKTVGRASWAGVLWGLGHTAALLVAGLALVLLKLQIPPWLARWLELAVAAMLVALGVSVLRKASLAKANPHEHHHHDAESPRARVGMRPFLVGIVHGMAGSASLMLLVLATISSPWVALGYVAIFGLGSIGGMLSLSWLISLPFAFTATRFDRINLTVRVVTGVFSCLFGLYLAWQIVAVGSPLA